MRIFYLYGVSHKTCFDVIPQVHIFISIGIAFLFALTFFISALYFVQTNCDMSQKNSAVVIF